MQHFEIGADGTEYFNLLCQRCGLWASCCSAGYPATGLNDSESRSVIPTDEQKAILDATGRVVLINARAGTGKSTTLRMVSELAADRRIVYLVVQQAGRGGG